MSNLITKKFKIVGMHCVSCAINIDFDLEDLKGITTAKTNYAKQICEVTYDEKYISEKEIISQINKTGYEVAT